MLNKYYNTELARLRAHSLEFALANPAIAPMLGSSSTDPDIELLLQGVAFLNGLTRQKLDSEFPEIAQELASIFAPQILRPMPAATMMLFTPKALLAESVAIPEGTEVASVPLEQVSCSFRTTATLQIHPVDLNDAVFTQTSAGLNTIRLSFTSIEVAQQLFVPDRLRLFLSDEHESAADLLLLLHNHVKTVRLSDDSGVSVSLPSALAFPGFDEALIPYPSNAFSGFCWLQELLFFPQKFLFVEFYNLASASTQLSGSHFYLEIELDRHLTVTPKVSRRSFQLNVTPAVNLFNQQAEPISITHEETEHPIVPDTAFKEHYQIYSIDTVVGMRQGEGAHKTYYPFSSLNFVKGSGQASYRASVRQAVGTARVESYISLAYPPELDIRNETLSIKLTCTNRTLPEKLKLGDVSRPTNTSPERFAFANITPITGSVETPYGEKLLWDVVSHAVLNIVSLRDIENLRAIIRLYNSMRTQDSAAKTINERQIDGMLGLTLVPENRLYRGMNMQGQHVKLSCQQDNWGSLGALHLWGCVIERFFASYAAINTYTRFEIEDKSKGINLKWPLRHGLKPRL